MPTARTGIRLVQQSFVANCAHPHNLIFYHPAHWRR
jgi:hypothetical protein